MIMFIISLCGQAITGWKEHNKELADEHTRQLHFKEYLTSGHFIEATFENWESEFLQMAMYVILTIKLRQIGAAESKNLDHKEEVDHEPKPGPDAPWPVKKGGWILKVYKNSLSLTLLILFTLSFIMHTYGSFENYNIEQGLKNKPQENITEFLMDSKLWFESFQNWQSEFLSVATLIFLSIYLRQYGSPESKPVDAPHMETGK